METLYVLQLEDGKYYVGKSNNVPNRYKQHKDGLGSAWTKKYRPVKILEVRSLKDEHDENNTTKDYMKRFGIENVRGGAYCQVDLLDSTIEHLELELNSSSDKCYTCGKPGHFARYCQEEIVWKCEFCPREFSSEKLCLAHEDSCQGQLGCCYRCGRTSHYSPDCYAKTHVNGRYLD